MFISSNHTKIFYDAVRVARRDDTISHCLILTYTTSTEYTKKFGAFVQCPITVIYGSHKDKPKSSKHRHYHIQYILGSQKHGRMHAKCMLLIGNKRLTVVISSANFAENKRSQNAFFQVSLRLKQNPTELKNQTQFQREMIRFFNCMHTGIKEELNRICKTGLINVLRRADFSPICAQLITTTPPNCGSDKVGLQAIQHTLTKNKVPTSELVTLQPTSFGANLNESFFCTLLDAFRIPKTSKLDSKLRIVVPKLCVYSKIQRYRLKAVPQKYRKIFEDLIWKNPTYNKTGHEADTISNVPHFKLYYGSDSRQTKVQFMLFTSMSMSLGACGRYVCPNNMHTIHKNQLCKCTTKKCSKKFVGRNFEMGVLFLPKTKTQQEKLAEVIPFV